MFVRTRNDDAPYIIDFLPNWFDARTFVNPAQLVEHAVRSQLDENLRPVE